MTVDNDFYSRAASSWWDERGPLYALHPSVNTTRIEYVLATLERQLGQGSRRVLDLGCGSGILALAAARLLAEHRSPIPLLAFTPVAEVRSQLTLTWGVETFLVPPVQHTDEMVRQVDSAMLGLGRMQPGEYVTIVAGSPPSTSGSTNAMRVHRLGSPVPTAPDYGRRVDDD